MAFYRARAGEAVSFLGHKYHRSVLLGLQGFETLQISHMVPRGYVLPSVLFMGEWERGRVEMLPSGWRFFFFSE